MFTQHNQIIFSVDEEKATEENLITMAIEPYLQCRNSRKVHRKVMTPSGKTNYAPTGAGSCAAL
jgi:hypothetical protein